MLSRIFLNFTGKPPFRRYQRSLTDTAFIFERANSINSGPTSPVSPSFNSPFSRTSTSPFKRPVSPPSPSFRPTSTSQSHPVLRRSPISPVQKTDPPESSLPTVQDFKPPPPHSILPVLHVSQVSHPPASLVLTDNELSAKIAGTLEIASDQEAPVIATGTQTEPPVHLKGKSSNIKSNKSCLNIKSIRNMFLYFHLRPLFRASQRGAG